MGQPSHTLLIHMSDQDKLQRFEELEAGRILGDLDADEQQEWEELCKDPLCTPATSLEQVAAAIDAEYATATQSEVPDSLIGQLKMDIAQFVRPESGSDTDEDISGSVVEFPLWKRVLKAPQTPWAIAAVLAMLLVANALVPNNEKKSGQRTVEIASLQEARDAIIASDDSVEMKFGGTETYARMTGDVVWSNTLQEGYMTLTNLPVNNPEKKQYQLWIVDPTRDDKPVDGGVFDIPEGADTAIIKINNPLVISDPKAFVITLEQPGGVVVSKQEVVVAVAKPS